jgi:hypothetical protein
VQVHGSKRHKTKSERRTFNNGTSLFVPLSNNIEAKNVEGTRTRRT